MQPIETKVQTKKFMWVHVTIVQATWRKHVDIVSYKPVPHKKKIHENNMNRVSLLVLLITPVVFSCWPGGRKYKYLTDFLYGKSNEEKTRQIIRAFHDIPDEYMYILFPLLTKVCYLAFKKPHFSKVHERRINENTQHFIFPINRLVAVIACHVSMPTFHLNC